MATGIELIFGLRATDAPASSMLKEMWTDFGSDEDDEGRIGSNFKQRLDAVNMALEQAFVAALNRMGFTKIKKEGHYYAAKTPLGPRKFKPFCLEMHYDPGEMHETPKEAVVGIAISGRYFPTLADWEDENGTIYPVVFDQKLAEMQKIAKEEILKVVPEMADCVWIVKEKFY